MDSRRQTQALVNAQGGAADHRVSARQDDGEGREAPARTRRRHGHGIRDWLQSKRLASTLCSSVHSAKIDLSHLHRGSATRDSYLRLHSP